MASTSLVTILVTDLVQSVATRTRLGDDRAEALRAVHFRLVRRAVGAHGGAEVKTMGDGFMVAFSSANDALACAVRIQQEIAAHNHQRPDDVIALRVGLNAGEATREGEDWFGLPVDLAHRICALAEGGQILVNDVVRTLVGGRGGHELRPVGEVEVKGVDEPLRLHELLWEPDVASEATAPDPTTPFVGRVDELESLREMWDDARVGTPRCVLISGEPGIGKTRLAIELANAARRDGATVLVGRCEDDTAVPYQAFVEALAGVLGANPFEVLGRRASSSPVPTEFTGEDAGRYLFFEGIRGAVGDLASESPVVLLLDDLHWADRGTLSLLRHVLRRSEQTRLLVVGTYRETELGRNHPLTEALGPLQREHHASRVSLSGLTEDEVRTMATPWLEAASSPDVVAAVVKETEGNPFFVEEVCRHLAESGGLTGVPQGVKEVIGHRLTRLSEDVSRVLHAASVIGRDFDLDVLLPAVDLDEPRVLDALDEAVAARLIIEVGLGRWSFTHALIRETLQAELGTTRRIRLHRRIGETLETLHGTEPGPHLAAMAHHFCEAAEGGDVNKAVDYAQRAGQQAAATYASEEAAALFELALQTLELAQPIERRLRCQLLLNLGQALRWLDYSAHITHMRDAAVIAEDIGDAQMLATAVIHGWEMEPGVVKDEDRRSFERVLELLPDEDSGLRAMALAAFGLLTAWGPDWQAGLDVMRAAADMADRVGDPDALAFVNWYLESQMVGGLDGSRTLAIAREHGLTDWIGPGLMMCMSADFGRGRRAHAEQDLTELLETSGRLGSPFQNAMALVAQASFAYLDGQLAEGRAISRKALEAGSQAMGDRLPRWVIGLWSVQEMGRLLEQGRAAALEPGSRALVAAYPTVPAWRTALAMVLALSGKADEARTEVDSFTTDKDRPLQEGMAGHAILAFLVRAAVALDDPVTAAQLAEAAEIVRKKRRCIVISNAPVPALFFGAVAHYQGLLAGLLERHEETDRFFAEALEIHERMSSPPWIARTQAEWAQFLIRREPERARQMLADAEAICRPLGLTDVLNQIDALTAP